MVPSRLEFGGFPGGTSGKELPVNAGDIRNSGFIPGQEDPLRRAWQLTLVLMPGESCGQKSLLDYSPLGHRESDTPEATWHSTAKETNHSVKNKSIRQN